MTVIEQLTPVQTNCPTGWLTGRRIGAHAIILAICLWGAFAVDFSTPGVFDRAGNIKFQDFIQFYISATLIRGHRSADLFSQRVADEEFRAIVGQPTPVRLPTVYGPQVGFLFVPLAGFSFLTAACIWAALGSAIYFLCVYAVWKCCPDLRSYPRSSAIAAIAFPPVFHFFVRGQISALLLAFLTLAFLAFHAGKPLLGGLALGCLFLKPQFLVAIPFVLLFARAWKPLVGLLISAGAQLASVQTFFGGGVLHSYAEMLRHIRDWIELAELPLAPIQMHSVRAFWMLLIPSSVAVFVLYILTSIALIWITAIIWKSQAPLALRFSALILLSALVSPHLFVYDLLVLAPMFLLLADWTLAHRDQVPILPALLYAAFLVPMIGPLSRWTHLQLSVIVFATILWVLFRLTTGDQRLASTESLVV